MLSIKPLLNNRFVNHGSSAKGFAGLSESSLNLIIFLVTGTISLFLALLWLPASFVDHRYVPMGVDSFYHAVRILNLINHGTLIQFDPKIHAPEGALLYWPWLYDFFIAKLVIVFQYLLNIKDPMYVIVRIPPFWIYVNAVILLLITTQLRLSLLSRFLILMCFALSPLTQELHGAGRIDHHYMELTMVLLVLMSGLNWMKNKDSIRHAIQLGLILGFAQGINNGQFVLQIPVFLTVFMLWVQKQQLNKNSIAALAAALVGSTLLILLPSKPFQYGLASYYYLSWFHLYIACSFSLVIMYMSHRSFNRKSLGYLCIIGLTLLLPVIHQVGMGSQFLMGDISFQEDIVELQNIYQQVSNSGFLNVAGEYSGLIFITPLVIAVWYFVDFKNNPKQEYLLLLVLSIFGTCFLFLQQRLNYYGAFAMYLPMILLFERFLRSKPHLGKYLWLGLAALLIVCYLPTLRHFSSFVPPGGSYDYAATRYIYPSMQKACAENPGVVLAIQEDGHFIRFHTDCSVIANPMIISPSDVKKVLLTQKIFSTPAAELKAKYPWIKYVYVRRNDNVMNNSSSREAAASNKGLRAELLFHGKSFPDNFKLIKQLFVKLPNGKIQPLARLFELK